MATLKIIENLIVQERNISNISSSLKGNHVVTDTLEIAQSDLQEQIMDWLPEWLPGKAAISHFYEYPEEKAAIRQNEQFLDRLIELMAKGCSTWAEVHLKRSYQKTDGFLLEEAWENFITVDELESNTGATSHGIIRISGAWKGLRMALCDKELDAIWSNREVEALTARHADIVAQYFLFNKAKYSH